MRKELEPKNESVSSPDAIKKASFLTYFEDIHGLIYYSSGTLVNTDTNSLRSVLVYLPADLVNATRFQITEDGEIKYFRKSVDNGGLKRISNFSSEDEKRIVFSRYKVDLKTGEPILAVPLEEVTKIYNPYDGFQGILKKGIVRLPEITVETIFKLESIFREYGININHIGIYGGLQVGIISLEAPTRGVKDIDILIQGLSYLPIVKEVRERFGKKIYSNNIFESLSYPQRAEFRRDHIAKIEINGIDIDIKLVRNQSDPNSFAQDWIDSNIETEGVGRIIEDLESLTTPSSFLIVDETNTTTRVSTAIYEYIGAGWMGDIVKYRGRLGRDRRQVLLIDPQNHFINYIP